MVLAVEIGAGLVVVLLAVGFSAGLTVEDFAAPFVCAFVAFSSTLLGAGFAGSFFFSVPFEVGIFFSAGWAFSTTASGIRSSNAECFLGPSSGAIDCFFAGISLEVSSSILKLVLRLDVLDAPLSALLRPI